MADKGSTAHPLVIDDTDDEEMDTSQAPPPRPKEPEIIEIIDSEDDDASKDGGTDEDDEAGGAIQIDETPKKADEVEVEQQQIPVLRTQHLEYLGDNNAAWATYTELRAASDLRRELDGKSIPLHVQNQDLPEFQPLYDPSPEELDRFAKLLPVLFPVKLYKYGGAYADRARVRSTDNAHYNDQYFYQSRKGGSPGPLVLAWGFKDNPSAIVAETLLISQSNSVNKNLLASIGRCKYTEARPGAVYAVPVLPVIEGVAIHTKDDFLGVHQSYYMKKKKGLKKKRKKTTHGALPLDYSALLDCVFNSGLGHKQLREVLMKKSCSGINKICAAAKGDVLAKLKAGNPRMEQGKTFLSNRHTFKKFQWTCQVSYHLPL